MTRWEALKKAQGCLERAENVAVSTESGQARVAALINSARVYVEIAKELRLGA